MAKPETAVLSDAVREAIGEESVIGALFLTYQFNPGFFEEHILAPLLGVPDAGSPAMRQILLEEALRPMLEVCVVYDRTGLKADTRPVQGLRTVPVRPDTGCLHAKHALLLLGDTLAAKKMVLLTTSANLTPSGWWRNIEAFDLQVLERGGKSSLATDLGELLDAVEELAGPLAVTEACRSFVSTLRQETGLPRLWTGKQSLPAFLRGHQPPPGGKLELGSPFVDERARPVQQLVDVLRPEATRVLLPVDREERVSAGKRWFDGVSKAGGELAHLDMERKVGAKADGTRFVHAKLFRLRLQDRTLALVGSPNLSVPGLAGWKSGAKAANFETALLVEGPKQGAWLVPCKLPKPADIPGSSADCPEDTVDEAVLAARVRYDWDTRKAEILVYEDLDVPVLIGSSAQDGENPVERFRVPAGKANDWARMDTASTSALLELLAVGTVLSVWCEGRRPRPVLVEEHGLALRPSRAGGGLDLADILKHWSLMNPRQRAAHVEQSLDGQAGGDPEATLRTRRKTKPPRTMFDAFAGVLHAFLVFQRRVRAAGEAEQTKQVVSWLLSEQHDSLPTLLKRVENHDGDPVYALSILLCAKEALETGRPFLPPVKRQWKRAEALKRRIDRDIAEAWAVLGEDGEDEEFRAWVERWWAQSPELPA